MAHKILTPISLWQDFDASLPLQPEIVEERETDGILYRETTFWGRQTKQNRVQIYGVEVRPVGVDTLPALLLLTEANRAVDLRLAERFARRGYCVFCMDYRGETAETDRHTVYPEDVEYANFLRSERHILHADEGAKKTAWYEWTAAAIYAVQYLRSLDYISSVGVMGAREGGEIAWKLMAVTELSCGICINAAGWLSHRNTYKFGEDTVVDMAEEKRLFLAGIDSQSYAPFVKCPVLMLVAISDVYVDADKAYDTYVRINQEQFSTINYSIGYGGAIDEKGIKNADMFMDKYLKERQIFIARPLEITLEDDGEESLSATDVSDGEGESICSLVYFAEDSIAAHRREWIKCTHGKELEGGKVSFPLPLYQKTETVFAFAQAEYSSGFTVSSKITFKRIEKDYQSAVSHSNILYDSRMDGDFFVPVDHSKAMLGGCFWTDKEGVPSRAEGYGKIFGMTCSRGLQTYRIAQRRYAPQERSMLHFNVYAPKDCYVDVRILKRIFADVYETFSTSLFCLGGGRWKNILLSANAFKSDMGASLNDFCDCHSLQFQAQESESFIINNILWI